MNKEPVRMRGVKKVYMVTVLEGNGTSEAVYREAKYFYERDTGEFLGKVDSAVNVEENA